MPNNTPKPGRIKTTFRIPEIITECMRKEVYEDRTDQNTIVVEELEQRYRAKYPQFFLPLTELESLTN